MNTRSYIVVGDLHDKMEQLFSIPELPTCHGVIITGDLTLCGGIRQVKPIIAAIAGRVPCLYAQIGNMDRSEVTAWLEEKQYNLHTRAKQLLPHLILFGVGYSPVTPFNTPSEVPDTQIGTWLQQAYLEGTQLAEATSLGQTLPASPAFVLISHSPPYNTACDRLAEGRGNVGSEAVRTFIETYQPDICICGHIHESAGEDYIGKTHILNPGPLPWGGYVLLEADADTPSILKASLKRVYI